MRTYADEFLMNFESILQNSFVSPTLLEEREVLLVALIHPSAWNWNSANFA
jgi:hypothetical protein